jgi:hypothetical protein
MLQASVLRWDLPPEIPDDVDDPTVEKASGVVVVLPRRVDWSPPDPTYDLSDLWQRNRVYEQVLREGTADDVRHFIDVDLLLDLWDELILPPAVSRVDRLARRGPTVVGVNQRRAAWDGGALPYVAARLWSARLGGCVGAVVCCSRAACHRCRGQPARA